MVLVWMVRRITRRNFSFEVIRRTKKGLLSRSGIFKVYIGKGEVDIEFTCSIKDIKPALNTSIFWPAAI